MTWPDGDLEPDDARSPWSVIVAVVGLFVVVSVAIALILRSPGPHPSAGEVSPSDVIVSSASESTSPSITAPTGPSAPIATSAVARPQTIVTSPARRTTAPSAAATRAGATAAVPAALEHPPPAQPVAPLAAPPEEVGLVDVIATLGYQDEFAEGTGMILTASGDVLTNNHVIEGATAISVVVVSTGAMYSAVAVGTDVTADVAVLALADAPALQVAPFGDSGAVAVGDQVVGVGNAGGVGGTPAAAPGVVTALNQAVVATSDDGTAAEHLSGMIASTAQIQPGDSGGPLYDASGQIIAMDTAGGTTGSGEIVAFSIPIDTALTVAQLIERGSTSSAIQLGTPAFLGVTAIDTSAGIKVQQVLAATPAAGAQLEPGDLITTLGGVAITSTAALSAALAAHHPGDQVGLTWIRPTAGSQSFSVTVTLAPGPDV